MSTDKRTRPFTKAEVVSALRAIIKEKPDAVNPAEPSGACLYHEGRGRNIKRCLIGELGYRLGLPTPHPKAEGVGNLTARGGIWDGRFTPVARNLLDSAQRVADGFHPSLDAHPNESPRRWGDIKVSALV